MKILQSTMCIIIMSAISAFAESETPSTAATKADAAYESSTEQILAVVPEIASPVNLSSSDTNRIACPADLPIQDVVYSTEKGIKIKYSGSNAFVKFQYKVAGGQEVYPTKPVEIFIVCGDNVYNLIATPKRIPSQTIRLSSGSLKKIKSNASLMGGLPAEKKVLMFIKLAYTDSLPESFEIKRPEKKFKLLKGLNVILKKQVSASGQGLVLKEYYLTNSEDAAMRLTEKDFLIADLTTNTLAVSMDKLNIAKGETSRLFIVEASGGTDGYQK